MKNALLLWLGLGWGMLAHAQTAVSTARTQVLKRELAEIAKADQAVRRQVGAVYHKYGPNSPQLDSLNQQIRRVDARNT